MENIEKLQNWKQVNINALIDNIDYDQIHELQIYSEYNDNIMIWADGEISVLGSNTTPNTNEWYAVIKAWGHGNVNISDYADGWAEEELEDGEPTGKYIEIETGKKMTEKEMIMDCIKNGDWTDHYTHIADMIREQYETDLQNLEDQIQNL